MNTAVDHHPAIGVRAQHGCKIEKSVRVRRPADELYRFWSDIERLPSVMSHLVLVKRIGGNRSHWLPL
jgi:uncharacterized membrane protein